MCLVLRQETKVDKVVIATPVRCTREGNVYSRVCNSVHMGRRRMERAVPMPQCTDQLSHDVIGEGQPPHHLSYPRGRTSQEGLVDSPESMEQGNRGGVPPIGRLSSYGIEFCCGTNLIVTSNPVVDLGGS